MNKTFTTVAVCAALMMSSVAASANADTLANSFFSKDNPRLTTQEKRALAIAKRWESGKGNGDIKPFTGRNGAIEYVYGVQEPSIVCSVLQVCDIAFQPGEQITGEYMGDSARWDVTPTVSGSGPSAVEHLIIKPRDVGLQTSLIVTTNRRVYHMRLKSRRHDYMPYVSFVYPQQAQAKLNVINQHKEEERQDNTMPNTHEYLGDLSFNYNISGSAPWKPIRVFNDGHKTIIQMPKAMKQTEAPTLLVIRKQGGWFTDPQTVMVNYRIQGDRYIVDSVFHQAILVSGVGSSQDKVTITKGSDSNA